MPITVVGSLLPQYYWRTSVWNAERIFVNHFIGELTRDPHLMQQFIYYYNFCIKWVSLVNFIYDTRTHIHQIYWRVVVPCVHFLPTVVFGTAQVLPSYRIDIKRVFLPYHLLFIWMFTNAYLFKTAFCTNLGFAGSGGRWLTGIAGSNPTGGMDILSLVRVVCCKVEVCATGRSPVNKAAYRVCTNI